MTNRLRSLLAAGSMVVMLAGCGGGGSNTPTPTPTPTPVVRPEDQFGNCFATRFRADPNTKATDPVPCPDLPAVTLTAKPASL